MSIAGEYNINQLVSQTAQVGGLLSESPGYDYIIYQWIINGSPVPINGTLTVNYAGHTNKDDDDHRCGCEKGCIEIKPYLCSAL